MPVSAATLAVLPSTSDVHLLVAPIRVPSVLPPAVARAFEASGCPQTIRRCAVPSTPFAPTAPTPAASGPNSFNLVVPTSLLESSFNLGQVSQRGLVVVFRTSSSPTACSSAAFQTPCGSASILGAVHGTVRAQRNLIGNTIYRLQGQQPEALAKQGSAGWQVVGFTTCVGGIVVDVSVRSEQAQRPPQQQQQQPLVVPLPRRFGDSLPPPTTVYRHRQPSPVTQAATAQQGELRQQSVFNSYAAAAAAAAAPAPQPEAPVSQPRPALQQAPQPEGKQELVAVEHAHEPVSADVLEPVSRTESAPVCATRRSERICAQQSKLASCADEVPRPSGKRPAVQASARPAKHQRSASFSEGIDLLLAAHVALSSEQGAAAPVLRKTLSLP